MKRILSFILSINLIFILVPGTVLAAPSWPSAVSIEADGGILMEAQTGTVLFAKNEDQPYYPASITKILTALIVLEHCSLDEEVTFSHDDVYNVEAGSSTAGIDEGDVLTVRDFLYALMLASANESANALACHVSGSREAFAELMNQTAESLGCTGSHFANPSGLNDENHYTTAHDMALITRAAIQNPDFLEIDGARNYKLPPTKRNLEGGYVANHHRMLVKNTSVYYPGAFAGKTGYTSIAGNTLVTCAEKNDMTLIAVVLNGHQTHYSDTKALFDFGFDRFQALKAVDHETSYQALDNDMTIGGMTAQDNISLEFQKMPISLTQKLPFLTNWMKMRRIMLLPAFYMNTRAIPLDRSICALLPIHRQIQKTYPPDHRHSLHRQKPALLLLQKLPSKRKFLMQMPVPAHRHVPPLPKRHFHSF